MLPALGPRCERSSPIIIRRTLATLTKLRALPHLTREQVQAALDYYAETPELVDEDIERQKQAYLDFHRQRQ